MSNSVYSHVVEIEDDEGTELVSVLQVVARFEIVEVVRVWRIFRKRLILLLPFIS
jgi:hypothetical protein